MTKVVFVSTVAPFPVDDGKKLVVSGILRYLIERYGQKQVTFVLLGDAGRGGLSPESMPCELFTLKEPHPLRRLWNVFRFALVRGTKSFQESMLYSARLHRELRATIAGIAPDLIVCDTFRVGQFFEDVDRPEGRYILYMDDLFSVRYRKMLDTFERYPEVRLDNPLGNFARFVPSLVRPLVGMDSVQKRLFRLEKRLVENREQECVRWFDRSLLINPDEAELLRCRTGHPSIGTIKPYLTNLRPEAARRYDGEPTFVFLGRLNVPHNRLSIAHFVRTQMEEVLDRMPGAKLRIIGRGDSEELNRLAERYGGAVSVEGFVEDLDAAFEKSCAMIVPLLFGSGVKIKTLEALSRGLPLISTDFGVEGIPVSSGIDCIVENDIDQYPRLMAETTETDRNRSISVRAKDFCHENYSEEALSREYGLLFGEPPPSGGKAPISSIAPRSFLHGWQA